MKIHCIINLEKHTSDDIFEAGQQYPKAKLQHIYQIEGESVDYIIIYSGKFDESLAKKGLSSIGQALL